MGGNFEEFWRKYRAEGRRKENLSKNLEGNARGNKKIKERNVKNLKTIAFLKLQLERYNLTKQTKS